MWQAALVIVIVAVSAVSAMWWLLPAAMRARLAGRLAARLPPGTGPRGWLRTWLESRARPTAPSAGCAACPQSRVHEPRSDGPPGAA